MIHFCVSRTLFRKIHPTISTNDRWYQNEHGGPNVTIGALLIYPSLLVPFYDAVVLGNLFQGWCQPCGASKAPATAAAGGDERLPEQPPALGGRQRPASRNFSSGGLSVGLTKEEGDGGL